MALGHLAARIARRATTSSVLIRLIPGPIIPPRRFAASSAATVSASAATCSSFQFNRLFPGGGSRAGALWAAVAPARASLSSAASPGDGADAGSGAGVPSEAQVTAALNEVNDRFGEARLLLGEARDALGSVYFEDDFRDAQEAVAHTHEAWDALLTSVAADPATAAELRRSTGQKMKQLDEELRVMTDALIHDD